MISEDIKEKLDYCLNCPKKPCKEKGCPMGNDIPQVISFIKKGELEKAYKLLSKTTVLPAICGRICPKQEQCEGSCVRKIKGEAVSIGDIEAYLADKADEENYEIEELEKAKVINKKVAVIGSGPCGLTCAAFLKRRGIDVTIYEKYDKLGGILSHGIPDFRLKEDVLQRQIDRILNLGINVEYGKTLGENLCLAELKKTYDAIFISIGANLSLKMNIENENLDGVYGGNELLEKGIHPDYTGKKVAVIGGGNVAMDCARTIKKKRADKVYIIYRRAEEQMPAERKEIEAAKKEDISFLFQNNITKIIGDKKVEAVECIKTKLVKKENDTRLSPVNIEGSNYILPVDFVIMAVGSKPNKKYLENTNLNLNNKGYINIDENNMTSEEKVFAGGDIAYEKATVAWACVSGRNAADNIIKYLEGKR